MTMLARAFDSALAAQTDEQQAWSHAMLGWLAAIQQESAVYIMVRRQYD